MTGFPNTARLYAGEWWDKHKEHVDRLIASKDDGVTAYPPSGSDRFHLELWRAPHWRWLKETRDHDGSPSDSQNFHLDRLADFNEK